MLYDFAKGTIAGRIVGRHRVEDANGRHVPYVRWCDTETGEVHRYSVTEGRFDLDRSGLPLVVAEKVPAPLTVLPLADDEPYEVPAKAGPVSPGVP